MQKKEVVEQMCSNVLNFRDIIRNKKEAKVLYNQYFRPFSKMNFVHLASSERGI